MCSNNNLKLFVLNACGPDPKNWEYCIDPVIVIAHDKEEAASLGGDWTNTCHEIKMDTPKAFAYFLTEDETLAF